MTLFREVNVWRLAKGSGLVRYRCFENLTNRRLHVRNADFFEEPITQEELDALDAYFYDFIADAFAEGPSEGYETLEEAIKAHEADFS